MLLIILFHFVYVFLGEDNLQISANDKDRSPNVTNQDNIP